MTAPRLVITIDTEGDNAWARPRVATTRNAEYLPRFQELCDQFGFKPTYLTNYEMAQCRLFQQFGRDVLARGAAEIGMHLHAWDSPPLVPLTTDDSACQPYLVEYPETVMREKVRVMTDLLEDVFGVQVVSHRAGRWSFDERYAGILLEHGYRVDCSVTPLLSWRETLGDPSREGGTDYTEFPSDAYWIDPADISRPGASPLLEVPVSVIPGADTAMARASRRLRKLRPPLGAVTRPLRRVLDHLSAPAHWLYPDGTNRQQLLLILARVLEERRGHAELTLHSSELMPGGSPLFSTPAQIETLYADLEAVLAFAHGRFIASTLSEYHTTFDGATHAAIG